MNTKEYIDLRFEQLKLKGTGFASDALGSVLAWILIIAVAVMLLTVLAFGGILLLGKALGNYALGALIVAGALLLVLIVLWLCRGVLFRGSFIRLLSGRKDRRDLAMAEEVNAVQLKAAESSDWSGIGSLGLRAIHILLRLAVRK